MSIEEKFKEILATQAFEKLIPFKEPQSWKFMTKAECELLGILFVKQGEHQLKNGDSRLLESFELASRVASQSPMVFFRQALVYASQGNNIRCLTAANKALSRATELDPNFMNAWHSWGNILVRMGLVYDDIEYFYQADEKFACAELLSVQQNARLDVLLWHRAICWFHIAKHSGEAIDFFRSLEKFRLAESQGCDNGEFHNDFGNILIDLACLLDRKELFSEAVEHYKKFTQLVPSQYEGWLNLACTYQRLYDISNDYDDFCEADRCFERAAALNAVDATVWFRWAEIYAQAGKAMQDTDRLQDSLDKFEKADVLEPENPLVLLRWGEALMLVGTNTENLELLREAQIKVGTAIEALPDDPDAWYIYGACYNELGRYFETPQYYHQAIEKFRYGLSLQEKHPLLTHALALAHFAIGELYDDVSMVQQSLHFFEKVEMEDSFVSPCLNDWGVALMKMGELTHEKVYIEAAAEKFEQAINHRMEHKGEAMDLEWLFNYGCAMDFLGDFHEESTYYEKAIQIFSHVKQTDPEHLLAHYHLALSLFHLGELNLDLELLQKAANLFHSLVQQEPEDELIWHDYGLTLLNMAVLRNDPAQTDEAHDLFEQAENKLQQAAALGSLYAFYSLACLYSLKENHTAAIHFLERAEQNDVLPRLDDLFQDEWLDNLREHNAFQQFLVRLRDKQK